MNTNKKFFAVLALLLLLVMVAQAQVGPNSITLSTNRLTAATTNSTAGTAFFVGNQDVVNVLFTAYSTNTALPGAGDTNGTTSTVTLRFEGSQDGITYFTHGTNWDLLFSPTGTNTHTVFKALDATPVQYFRPSRLSSTTTNAVFLPSATYWYK